MGLLLAAFSANSWLLTHAANTEQPHLPTGAFLSPISTSSESVLILFPLQNHYFFPFSGVVVTLEQRHQQDRAVRAR